MTSSQTDPGSLVVLSAYVDQNPPSQPFLPRRETLVYLKPSYRFRIVEEETRDLSYGLNRMEQLAVLGLSDAEVDTQTFCRGLLDAIGPQTSLHDLRNLELAVRRSRIENKDQMLKEDAQALAQVMVAAVRPLLTVHLQGDEAQFDDLAPQLTQAVVSKLQGKD